MDVHLHGFDLQLLPERGVYWPDQRMLLVADTHFGKEATFRHHGIAVPSGSTDGTLATIGRMLDRTAAIRLVILGDMFHARSSLSQEVCESIDRFWDRHDTVEFVLIRGNHDAHVGSLPNHWPIEVVDPGTPLGGLESTGCASQRLGLAHHPGEVSEGYDLVLCGHIHPAIRMSDRRDQLGKVACFWLTDRQLVLPAIGQFTGTHTVTPGPTDRAWLVAEDQVIAYRLPSPRRTPMAGGSATR